MGIRKVAVRSGLTLFSANVSASCSGNVQPNDKTNIVVILADDLGYGAIRAINGRFRIPTPNIDRLAAQGVLCTHAHAPAALCTPSKYSLLTGPVVQPEGE